MADLKKLTKLDNSLKIMKPQFKIIIDNLDKIFAVSETSMVNISKYLNEFNIEEAIFEDDNGERIVSLIKAGLKKYEKTQTDKCACLPIHINDYEWLAEYTIETMDFLTLSANLFKNSININAIHTPNNNRNN